MNILSHLVPIPLAQASATLRALAQASGQTVEARVLGELGNGATQVQVGRQTLSLQMPVPQPAGTVLTLSVQQVQGQVQVALVGVRPPTIENSPTPVSQQAAASVQLSSAALAGSAAPNPATTTPGAGKAPGPQANAGASVSTARPPLPGTSPAPQISMAIAGGANAPAMAGRPAVPYAVAPPAAGAAPVSATGSAATALPPVAQSMVASVVGQHAAPPNVPNAAPGAMPTAPPAPSTPQAALAQMVQQALPQQNSVLGLTAALTQVLGRVALPEPVVKAAQQVLSHRLSLGDKLDGATLQQAVRQSGIFQEAMLGAGQAKAAGGDLKTALLGLQRQLGAWLGEQAPVAQVHGLPPPLKGMAPRARQANLPLPDLPDDPESAGKVLLERTEAALSRLRLHQHTSLPEQATHRSDAQWSLDLPVMVAGQQALLQMQIHKDAEDANANPEERGWQVRFAINLSDIGEVGAQISLRGRIAGILLWADRPEVAALLNTGLDDLRDELNALGLAAGTVVVRAGAPAAAPASSGHVLDALR